MISLAVGVGAGGSGGVGAALGIATAINQIGDSNDNQAARVRAFVDNSTVTSGAMSIAANATSDIDALTIGGSVGVGCGRFRWRRRGRCGSRIGHEIYQLIEASIINSSSVTAGTGGVSLAATDASSITANRRRSGCLSRRRRLWRRRHFARRRGCRNKVGNEVVASIIDSTVVANQGDISLTASEQATIEALTIGGAVGVGAGGAAGVGIGLAGAGSGNIINNTVHAQIRNADVDSSAGNVSLSAQDQSQIVADAGAFLSALELAEPQELVCHWELPLRSTPSTTKSSRRSTKALKCRPMAASR